MHHREAVERSLEDTSGTSATGPNYNKGNMKQFKIEVSHATPQQLATIALELKIMSNGWTRHGPRILINGQKLQAPSLHESRPQASSRKRHNMAMFR